MLQILYSLMSKQRPHWYCQENVHQKDLALVSATKSIVFKKWRM